ncbi:hypothetical protein [Microlunatus sp. Y2014]|uniref:hypothetical protein n=1 Tax=Microlunatus sp. Y2014 TaxID=3418488 RepID=UPI003DA709A5
MSELKVALEALTAEEGYLRDMAKAQSSLSSATVGMPDQIPEWGPWTAMKSPMVQAFTQFDETVSSSEEALNAVADLIRETKDAYAAAEAANMVP